MLVCHWGSARDRKTSYGEYFYYKTVIRALFSSWWDHWFMSSSSYAPVYDRLSDPVATYVRYYVTVVTNKLIPSLSPSGLKCWPCMGFKYIKYHWVIWNHLLCNWQISTMEYWCYEAFNSFGLKNISGIKDTAVNIKWRLYTVSQKNDNDVVRYNFNAHQPILIIFGRDIAEWICYEMVICYPTSHN